MRIVTTCGILALTSSSLFADFSYKEATKITGGVALAGMKLAGTFSKGAREAMDNTASVALKGNRLVHRGSSHMSIIDLDAQTITDVDFQRKQYSVLTFEEMKQALENLAKKMKKDQNADMKMKVSADATGKTKEINGYNAKEIMMKIAMEMTDPKSKQNGSMVVYTDLWIAENIAGYSEVADFYKKMSAQLNWAPGGSMFMQQPEVAKGVAEAFKEVSKLNGAPVFQKMSMGPEGMQPPSSDGPTPAAAQEQKPKASAGSVLGGALGSRLGGLGGLGRKKQQQEPPPQEQPAGQQQQQPTGSMIEMETQYSDFATTADASLFDIPAAFKKVDSEMKKIK